MRAARVDRNHGELVGLYRELGCYVADTSRVGFGFPDIVVGMAGAPADLVEIKMEEGDFTSAQVIFHRDWRGRKPIVVRTREDVIAHVQRVRKQLHRGIQ